MEMIPVPEERSIAGLDDDSSCSTLSNPDDALQESAPGKRAPPVASKTIIWRNLFFGCLGVTAVILAIGAYVALSNGEASDSKLSGIFVGVIVLAFVGVAVIFYFYDHNMRLGLNEHDGFTPSNTDDFMGATGRNHHIYAMSSNGSMSAGSHGGNGSDGPSGVKRVQSLLQKPFKSFRNHGRSSSSAQARMGAPTDQEAMMASGMASTESINNFLGAVKRQSSFLSADNTGTIHQTKPVAEFFAETTVLFADIVGFTAWSSVREPSQVFTLLETLFHAFDAIAQRRKVFKVETVGDCYVAVTGLPEPTKEHGVIMAHFARECLQKMGPLCQKMETQLGPDTGDLNLRIGIHSGAVTGGVLRGKRSRFQLFGDTVNTASRIESTGEGGRIHLSDSTAELIRTAGKEDWLIQRENQVMAKGKGNMTTYWLKAEEGGIQVTNHASGTAAGSNEDGTAAISSAPAQRSSAGQGVIDSVAATSKTLGNKATSAKVERLVSWNVDLLHRLLKQIVARRNILVRNNPKRKMDADEAIYMTREDTLLEEVKESIELPADSYFKEAMEDAKNTYLDPVVYHQLQDYVRSVADMYPNHPFHNFEHASHVTMSVAKLLSRIVAPSANEFTASADNGQTLDDHTYGITSDPLTQFACVLSALMHDVDHPGVPNSQLVKEETSEAKKYKGKSVAEQNSFDKCWELLMEPKYDELRRTIYTTKDGLARFRSLLVNSVLATDICDKDLKALRNARWDKAFNKDGKGPKQPESQKAAKDRKATIVIEHLIQASDVSHTMQHWHVYRRWNERLFRECYNAYTEGRADKDPSECWYEGEKGFFDFYIIPLAKKLKECGVFGVSSSEYLDYALNNRKEWEAKGKDVVQEMIVKVKMIEQQKKKKKEEEEAAKKKAEAEAKEREDGQSNHSMSGSSGMLSFDSRASLGHLGPLE